MKDLTFCSLNQCISILIVQTWKELQYKTKYVWINDGCFIVFQNIVYSILYNKNVIELVFEILIAKNTFFIGPSTAFNTDRFLVHTDQQDIKVPKMTSVKPFQQERSFYNIKRGLLLLSDWSKQIPDFFAGFLFPTLNIICFKTNEIKQSFSTIVNKMSDNNQRSH